MRVFAGPGQKFSKTITLQLIARPSQPPKAVVIDIEKPRRGPHRNSLSPPIGAWNHNWEEMARLIGASNINKTLVTSIRLIMLPPRQKLAAGDHGGDTWPLTCPMRGRVFIAISVATGMQRLLRTKARSLLYQATWNWPVGVLGEDHAALPKRWMRLALRAGHLLTVAS